MADLIGMNGAAKALHFPRLSHITLMCDKVYTPQEAIGCYKESEESSLNQYMCVQPTIQSKH